MGTLLLGRIARIDLDDDVLAHVHAVIIAKLRVREPVSIAWVSEEGLRDEIIVNPATTVVTRFASPESQRLDRMWLNRLMIAANSTRGLNITPELVQAFRLEREAAASGAHGDTSTDAAGPARPPSLRSVPPATTARSGQPRGRRASLAGD